MTLNFSQLLEQNSQFFTLKTERLELRLLVKADVPERFAVLQKYPEITEHLTFDPPEAEAETLAHFQYFTEKFKNNAQICWSILWQDQMIGTISLDDIVWQELGREFNKAVIGYWLSPEFHGQGFMTEAAQEVVDFAFAKLDLNKLEIAHASANRASERVIEKMVFRFLAEKKQHFKRHGQWWDEKIYECLKTEWEGRRKVNRPKQAQERQIWLVDLEPTKGVEIRKVRPCLILRKFSQKQLLIIPITSQEKSTSIAYDLGAVSFLSKPVNFLNISHMRTIDLQRCNRYMGKISPHKFACIQKKSAEVLKLLPRGPNGQSNTSIKV